MNKHLTNICRGTVRLLGLSPVYLAGSLLISTTLFADFTPADWKYSRELKIAGIGKVTGFYLDEAVLGKTQPGLVDLRIIEGGAEAPYEVVTFQGQEEERNIPLAMLNNSTVPGNYVSFIAAAPRYDLPEGKKADYLNRITISTPDKNFRRQVEILGSDSADKNWNLLTKNGLIFNTRGGSYEYTNCDVDFPPSVFRYLKVIIYNGREKDDLHIIGASVRRKLTVDSKIINFTSTIGTKTNNEKVRALEYVCELSQGIQDISGIKVELDGWEYYRNIRLEASLNGKDWFYCSGGSVYKFEATGLLRSESNINIGAVRARYLKLSIVYEDGKPVGLKSCNVYGYQKAVCFRPEKDKKYTLYYGNEKANRPSYPDVRTFSIAEASLKTGVLGAEIAAVPDEKAIKAAEDKVKRDKLQRILFIVVIVLVGIGLFFLVVSLYRQSEKK